MAYDRVKPTYLNYTFFNEASHFFPSSFNNIVCMSPQIRSYVLGLYSCFKALGKLFIN